MLVLPSKSSNRFVWDDVEGCVKCSSTWMAMFSFDTEVPQTGQIEHDGGRSISWRYSSSRRLFISNDATPDQDNITASIRMSCFRFGKGLREKINSNSSNHNESLDYLMCHQLNVTRRYEQVLSIITRHSVSRCHARTLLRYLPGLVRLGHTMERGRGLDSSLGYEFFTCL